MAEHLLLALEELSDLEQLADDTDADAREGVFGDQAANVDARTARLRGCLRALRGPLVEMSRDLVGAHPPWSLLTHARTLAAFVDD